MIYNFAPPANSENETHDKKAGKLLQLKVLSEIIHTGIELNFYSKG